MNFIKTATAVSGGIILASVIKSTFNSLVSRFKNNTPAGNDPQVDDPKETK